MVKMSLDILSVLKIDISQRFLCQSCGNLVIPDHARQAACGELICGDCAPHLTNCNEHSSHPFEKSIIDSSFKKEIGEVMVRCEWQREGCRWIGTFSDLAVHKVSCQWKWSLGESHHEGQSAEDLTISTKVMAEKYENAYFLWSWRGEKVNGEPVLSDIRVQDPGSYGTVSRVWRAYDTIGSEETLPIQVDAELEELHHPEEPERVDQEEDLPECTEHHPSSFEKDGQIYYGYCSNCLYPMAGDY